MSESESGGWNFRVVRRNGELSIYEIYYNSSGVPRGISEDPVVPVTDTLDELTEVLDLMKVATEKEILDYDVIAGEDVK